MAAEAFLFVGILFVVLLVVGWRSGRFRRDAQGDRDVRSAFPQVQPGGTTGQSIRDPRSARRRRQARPPLMEGLVIPGLRDSDFGRIMEESRSSRP
jgi:hypothetical protein